MAYNEKLAGRVRAALADRTDGRVTYREGKLAEARRLMEESIASFRESAWPYGVAWSLITLGWIATDQTEFDHARKCLTESLMLFRDLGARARMIECLEGFAQLAVAEGWFERAVRLASATATLRLAIGVALSPGERAGLEPEGPARPIRAWTRQRRRVGHRSKPLARRGGGLCSGCGASIVVYGTKGYC